MGRSRLQTCRRRDEVAAHRLPSEGGKGNGEKEQDLGSKDACNPTEFSKLHSKKETPSLFSRRSIHKGRHFKNNPDFWIGGPFTSKVPQSLKKEVNWGDASYHGAHRVRWGGRRGWA